MLQSFLATLGSLLFAIFFLLVLQLDWRGETLEMHFVSWMKQSSVTRALKKKSKILQVKINKKVIELKKEWEESVIEKPSVDKSQNRLKKLTKSIQKKFKRSLSNTKK